MVGVWPLAVGLALALQLGCSDDDRPTSDPLFSISGHVVVQGTLRSIDGESLGTRTISDADGLPVYLATAGTPRESTTTVDGRYEFSGLAPGSYRAFSIIGRVVADTTEALVISMADVATQDTLRLRPVGDVDVAPNPFSTGLRAEYALPATDSAFVFVTGLAGVQVRSLVRDVVGAGRREVQWDGLDENNEPVPAGAYWMMVVQGDTRGADLAIKEP